MFMNSKTKDRSILLDAFNTVITARWHYLEYWLNTFLIKLFNKSRLWALKFIWNYGKCNSQLSVGIEFRTDPAQTPNNILKLYSTNYIGGIRTYSRGAVHTLNIHNLTEENNLVHTKIVIHLKGGLDTGPLSRDCLTDKLFIKINNNCWLWLTVSYLLLA